MLCGFLFILPPSVRSESKNLNFEVEAVELADCWWKYLWEGKHRFFSNNRYCCSLSSHVIFHQVDQVIDTISIYISSLLSHTSHLLTHYSEHLYLCRVIIPLSASSCSFYFIFNDSWCLSFVWLLVGWKGFAADQSGQIYTLKYSVEHAEFHIYPNDTPMKREWVNAYLSALDCVD